MQNENYKDLPAYFIKWLATTASVLFVFYFAFGMYKDWQDSKLMPLPPFVDDGFCNVVTVPISGNIGIGATTATFDSNGVLMSSIPSTGDVDRVIHDLEYLKNYPGIEAVILQVDSYGGYGNASQVLNSYISKYPKPIVSLIRDAGTSMGYAVTLATERIFAYPGAMIGSIGVNTSFTSNVEKNKKEGIEYVSIVSGKYKDIGTPDKPLSEEELKYLKLENKKFYELFVDEVAINRQMSRENVEQLADGRIWLSDEAKELGLIDEVGDVDSVLSWFDKYWYDKGEYTKKAIPCAMY